MSGKVQGKGILQRALEWLSPRRRAKLSEAKAHDNVVASSSSVLPDQPEPVKEKAPPSPAGGKVVDDVPDRQIASHMVIDNEARATRVEEDAGTREEILATPRESQAITPVTKDIVISLKPAVEQVKVETLSGESQEGAQSQPQVTSTASLNVVIIGAGLGGLATAYLLGKDGHKVTLLEAASQLGEVGAGIQLSCNATRLFQRWGVGDKLKEIGVIPQALLLRRYEDGELLGWRGWGDAFEKAHGAPYYQVHRADIHRILVDLAEPLATIKLNSRVVTIDPSGPAVTLESGEILEADLVIGADGVHSLARDVVVGQKDSPVPTEDAAYRATIPAELLLADPDLKALIEDQSCVVWMGPGRHIVGYCIRNKELFNLVLIHPAHEIDENVREASIETMKADYTMFEPRVQKLLELVPSTLVWSLMDRRPLDSWVHSDGKLCLLGDACHPMLPYRAQGAAMAIEDAAVLANLLGRITAPSELPSLLQAYQSIRHTRATQTQTASRLNQHIFHLPDGPEQRARDASMKLAMEAALKEAKGEAADDCAGSANLWADRERNKEAFDYDADAEVEKWWREHREHRGGNEVSLPLN